MIGQKNKKRLTIKNSFFRFSLFKVTIFLLSVFLFFCTVSPSLAQVGLMNGKFSTGLTDDYLFWLQTYDEAIAPFYTSHFYVNKLGNVGIGTTSPAFKLEVLGTGSFSQPVVVGTPINQNHAATKDYVDSAALGGGGGDSLWGLSGSNLYASSTDWNVGIGTASPTQQLSLTKSLSLPNTTASDLGVIYKGVDRFIHNFQHPTGGGAVPDGYNIFIGEQAGNFTMGSTATSVNDSSHNIGIGYQVLSSNTTSMRNSAVGSYALAANTTGSWNAAFGYDSLRNNTTGVDNAAFAYNSLLANTSGSYNSALGYGALRANTTGQHNSALGNNAGWYLANGTTANQTSNNSVFLGSLTRSGPSAGATNQVVIGYEAIGLGSNTVVLGNDSIVTTALKGNVGIGTTTPAFKLDVIGTGSFSQPVVVGTPINDEHATTKSYVDSALSASGGDWILDGTKLYASSTDWTVGIGTLNPDNNYILDVVGTARFGNIQMATSTSILNMALGDIQGVGKLTVQTIDPLYRIKGINYSTFAPSVVGGVKEEYVGRAKISKLTKNGEYELVIDFSKQALGSDLWVWHQVVDFAKERVEVLITPYGRFAQTYYLIDNNKLIFRADRPVEVSYRLIGHRHDWREWPTIATDQEEMPSFIID